MKKHDFGKIVLFINVNIIIIFYCRPKTTGDLSMEKRQNMFEHVSKLVTEFYGILQP